MWNRTHMRPRIVEKISTMTDEQLLTLFNNAVQILSAGSNAAAHSVVASIACELKQRLDRARAGQFTTARPTKGMLHELGYKVGENGEKMPIRRQILKHMVEIELPLVGSPAYTDEWGTPSSPKRYHKLIRFFEGQLNNPTYDNMPKAIIERREDFRMPDYKVLLTSRMKSIVCLRGQTRMVEEKCLAC
jgi:hypothetical protein